ncbi:peptidoglycan/LPS O-acetylase OafA/YrhL [Paraburkholderia sp. GAS199]|uniref:acyltransferase family protein n=1 Tax=Paraburkholderia sp. GAS199 TaxID=3035126 RepID=UPI003D218DDF
MKENVSTVMDISRWVAALLVVANHARSLILADFGEVQNKTLFNKALYLVTGLGHEAVVVFFVISGFLVGGLTLDRWQARGPDLRSYASARTSRIYTTLIPALLVGAALDFIGSHWVNASALYSSVSPYHIASINYALDSAMTLPTFFGNLFMMQGTLTPPLGSNGALWSLAYEWWYYCIFAGIAAAMTGRGNLTTRTRYAYGAVALLIALLLPYAIVLWGAIWVLGIVTHRWIRSTAWRPAPLAGFACFIAALVVSRISHNVAAIENSLSGAFLRDLLLGLCYCVALASSSRLKQPVLSVRFARWHQELAQFSYTTYLFHLPALVLLCAALYQLAGWPLAQQPDGAGIAYLTGAILLTCLYCFAMSTVTERYTPNVRRKLDTLLTWASPRSGLSRARAPEA